MRICFGVLLVLFMKVLIEAGVRGYYRTVSGIGAFLPERGFLKIR